MSTLLRILLVLVIFLEESNSARILGITGIPSYSHQLFYRPIWLELAKRGHHITLLTTDPIKDVPNNIRQIDLHFSYQIRHVKHNITMKMQEHNLDYIKVWNSYGLMLEDIVENELNHPEVVTLIKNETEKFDLLITEYIPRVLSAFSVRFNCPYISIFSTETGNFYHQALGNPLHPVLYPEPFLPRQINLNFQERLLSTFYHFYLYIDQIFYETTKEDLMVKRHFGDGYPPISKIIRNVSMVFVNSHPVFNVKPLGPGFVRIAGGLHMKEKQELPQEIKEFLDSASEGAIYFSLGTNVRRNHIAEEFLKIAAGVFKELPYKIIWKLEADITEISSNIKIFKWLPQQDVLRHKNIKLFITQCGAQSLEEAILAQVPLLAIPYVSDQKMKARKIVDLGLGIEIDKDTMTKEILKSSILEVIRNSSYLERVRETANLLLDEPMSSLEKAIWWTEYVIRHKGARHFWHPNIDLPLYQYLLLDVMGFVLVILVVSIYSLYKTLKFVIRLLGKWRRAKTEKQKTS